MTEENQAPILLGERSANNDLEFYFDVDGVRVEIEAVWSPEDGGYLKGLTFRDLESPLTVSQVERLSREFSVYHYPIKTYFRFFVEKFSFPYPKQVLESLFLLPLTPDEKDAVRKEMRCITYVYLIRDQDTGYIKIGRSDNPKQRLKELLRQVTLLPKANRFTLEFAESAYWYVEKALHRRYAEHRVRGEWFDLNDTHVADICAYLRCA